MKQISQLSVDLKRAIQGAENAIGDNVIRSIGEVMRIRILKFIAGGQSPIIGKGRYPEYKGQVKKGLLSKLIRNSKSPIRRRELRQKQRALPKAYPLSVQKRFPGKKPRPVNLFLSGAFLNSLTFVTGPGRLILGFFDKESIDKERGHREGANRQPKRPIIPQNGEKFNVTITAEINKFVRAALRKYFASPQ